jgi:hypothetical protein
VGNFREGVGSLRVEVGSLGENWREWETLGMA